MLNSESRYDLHFYVLRNFFFSGFVFLQAANFTPVGFEKRRVVQLLNFPKLLPVGGFFFFLG